MFLLYNFTSKLGKEMSWDQVQMVILGVTPEHGIGWSKQQSGFDNKIHVRTGQEKIGLQKLASYSMTKVVQKNGGPK